MRCLACRRPLRNPVSIEHQLGPDCLKKAVRAGNAPLEALEQLTEWQRSRPKAKRAAKPAKATTATGPDLFETLRSDAIARLQAAADECRHLGITLTIEIK